MTLQGPANDLMYLLAEIHAQRNPIQNHAAKMIATIESNSISFKRANARRKPLVGAFVALLLFMFIYCARPEDWIPGLSNVPLAKVAGILAVLALAFSIQHIRQRMPREVIYLALLIGQLFVAASLSSVWRGGAILTTLDFAKVLIVVLVMVVAVTSKERLELLIVVQAASVAIIAAVAILKGHLMAGRLAGALGGIYSNPNDLALAIIVSAPLCLALLFLSRSRVLKVAWVVALLVMLYAVFLTGSRAGFLSLLVAVCVCLWEFAIRGRKRYLLVLAIVGGVILWQSSSGMLAGRLMATFDSRQDVASAYASSEQRQQLLWRSIEITERHPLFGIGPGNFAEVSGSWLVTHNAYTQMSSEGGIPAFLLYVLILWSGFKNARVTKQLMKRKGEFSVLAKALNASLAAYIVGSFFASSAYQFFPYLFVAYTTVLWLIAKKFAIGFAARKTAEPAIVPDPIQPDSNVEILWGSS
jgi:O-antigen ligase